MPDTNHSNGKGLSSKPAQFKDECVSVRDGRLQDSAFQQQSKHPALVTKLRYDRRDIIKSTSTAHFTSPVCRGYNLKVIDPKSRLTEDSAKQLLNLYNTSLSGGRAA